MGWILDVVKRSWLKSLYSIGLLLDCICVTVAVNVVQSSDGVFDHLSVDTSRVCNFDFLSLLVLHCTQNPGAC